MFCASSPNNHVRGLILTPLILSKGYALTLSLRSSSRFSRLNASAIGLDQNDNFCPTDPGSKPIPTPPALTSGLVCSTSSNNPFLRARNAHSIAVNVLPEPASP